MTPRTLAQSIGWALAFGLAAWVGRQTAISQTGLSLVAPSAGVAALWLLRSPRRMIPVDAALVGCTSLVVSAIVHVQMDAALVLAPSNVVLGLVVRAMLRAGSPTRIDVHEGRLPSLRSTQSLILLGAASLVASLASAPFASVAGYLITGHTSWLGSGALVIRNATSVFTLACAVLALATALDGGLRDRLPGARTRVRWPALAQEERPHAVADLVLSFLLSGVVLALVFINQLDVPLAFVPLAVSAFVGFRFTPAVAATQTLLTSVVAVVATLAHYGPFGIIENPLVAAMAVQAFVLIQTAIAVTLSFAVSDRLAATSALQAARLEASERAQLLDSVTHSLSHGLAVVDGTGRVLVKNAAARRIIDGDEPRLDLAKSPADYGLRHLDGSEITTAEMPHVIAFVTGRAADLEMLLASPDGDGPPAVMHVRAEPLELHGPGARRVAVVTFDDVTQQRSQVQQLESFAGVVAHDLQNPLAAVTSWTEVLTDHLTDLGAMDDFSAQTLERISRSGQTMSDLIADLLAYASASSAALDLQSVDLDQLVGTLATELRAANPHAPIITVQPLGVVTADPVLMRQLFTNVLGNAVKYVPSGTRPRVRVTSRRDDHRLEVSITDNGIGIPAEFRESVFQGFVRAHGSAAYAGTGLGLAICARAVERHGGSITALEGATGTGTTIRIQLPVRVAGASGTVSEESARG